MEEIQYRFDVKRFTGHKDEVNCIAFSSDFEILVTGSDDERVRVFNTNTGVMVARLKGQLAAIRSVAISDDSAFIASGSFDKTVIIYRTCDASTLHHLRGHLKSVESVTFSPCGQFLCSTSWDRTGILWDVSTGCILKLFQGHSSLVQCSAFSLCGRMLATGSWDHTVRIWPLKRIAGDHLHVLSSHKSNVHAVKFSRHHILATGAWDKQIFLWNPFKAEIIFCLAGHTGWVQALAFSEDGQMLASAADDDMVKIWRVLDGSCLQTLEGKTETAAHCGFHPTGTLIASGAATPLVMFRSKLDELTTGSSADTQNQAIVTLEGQDVLDEPIAKGLQVKNIRAQSARLCQDSSSDQHCPRRATSAVPIRRSDHKSNTAAEMSADDSLDKLNQVEQWLTVSFQRL